MEEKLGQSTAVLFKYEKLILAEEETTSAGGCGVSLAAFSRPASACPSDRVSRGFFKVGSLGEDQMCKLDHALEVSVGLLPLYNTI